MAWVSKDGQVGMEFEPKAERVTIIAPMSALPGPTGGLISMPGSRLAIKLSTFGEMAEQVRRWKDDVTPITNIQQATYYANCETWLPEVRCLSLVLYANDADIHMYVLTFEHKKSGRHYNIRTMGDANGLARWSHDLDKDIQHE